MGTGGLNEPEETGKEIDRVLYTGNQVNAVAHQAAGED